MTDPIASDPTKVKDIAFRILTQDPLDQDEREFAASCLLAYAIAKDATNQ